MAFPPGSSGSAYSVDVGDGAAGEVEVDDQVDALRGDGKRMREEGRGERERQS